ncbi:hypothetical protein Q8A67_020110 [Cirrhinus molitorella]|uniref:Uncharacterized protein n=1 Tax=Cirrhinus molitorella TaxID=172907 RepID=A0AA88PC35_9TELE|nr:hypothetical protein Q8A67_020110 [Cirrhinus molitorella]
MRLDRSRSDPMKPDWTRSAPVVLPLMADVSQRVYELILLQEPRQADKASHSAEKLHHHHRRAKKIRTEPAPVTGPSAAGSAGNVRVQCLFSCGLALEIRDCYAK